MKYFFSKKPSFWTRAQKCIEAALLMSCWVSYQGGKANICWNIANTHSITLMAHFVWLSELMCSMVKIPKIYLVNQGYEVNSRLSIGAKVGSCGPTISASPFSLLIRRSPWCPVHCLPLPAVHFIYWVLLNLFCCVGAALLHFSYCRIGAAGLWCCASKLLCCCWAFSHSWWTVVAKVLLIKFNLPKLLSKMEQNSFGRINCMFSEGFPRQSVFVYEKDLPNPCI